MATRMAWKPATDEVLCEAGCGDLTLDELRARVHRPLARMVAAMCDWGPGGRDGRLGDVRFLILAFTADGGLDFYVQILAEPGEPVLAEAASGAWQGPRVRGFMTPARRAALRAEGYRIGGKARNFEKRCEVSDRAAAGQLADELLRILHGVYGYRGRQSLLVTRVSDARCEPAPVFTRVAVDDVRKMTEAAGFPARPLDLPPGATRVERRVVEASLIAGGPFPFVITLCGDDERTGQSFTGVRFQVVLGGTASVPDDRILAVLAATPFIRLMRDDERNVKVSSEVALEGASERYYQAAVRRFVECVLYARHKLLAKRPDRPPRSWPRDASAPEGAADDSAPLPLATRQGAGKPWVH